MHEVLTLEVNATLILYHVGFCDAIAYMADVAYTVTWRPHHETLPHMLQKLLVLVAA